MWYIHLPYLDMAIQINKTCVYDYVFNDYNVKHEIITSTRTYNLISYLLSHSIVLYTVPKVIVSILHRHL